MNKIKSNIENKSNDKTDTKSKTESKLTVTPSANTLIYGNSTSHGEEEKAYELNKTEGGSVAKQIKSNITYFIALITIILILLAIGYKRNKKFE